MITDEERDVIFSVKSSLLYHDGVPWQKNESEGFDVTMGSYDGAETADLVGLFLLSKLQNLGIDPGLYRDDGAAATGKLTPRQVSRLQDKIVAIFDEYGLDVTIEVNKSVVNFLDITLDLPKEEYRPYMKPNGEPVYVHADSNHPPRILQNIPKSINNRISKLSANKEIFDAIKPKYQEALNKSGYDYVMEYDPSVATACDDRRRRKGNRKRNVIYFNPPYSKTIKTNIGRVFLNIIREEFSKGHPLYPVINKNNIKMSYRCMPNMSQQINRHNKKLLSKDTVKKNVANVTLASDDNNGLESFSNNNNTVAVIVTLANDDHVTMIRDHREVSSEEATQSSNNNTAASPDVTSVSDDQATPANNNKTCNCSKANRSTCPLKGNCLVCCLVYRATVTRIDNCNCETCTGVAAGTFKCRWYGHCDDMTHRPSLQSSSLTADISINLYLPLHPQKTTQKKRKARNRCKIQYIYTYLFLFNSSIVHKTFHFGTLTLVYSNL